MSVFRPSNINRRLVGTATTNTNTIAGKGSPGNGGQIGPKKVPYIFGQASLGSTSCGGCSGGVFKLTESFCGTKEFCGASCTEFKGFLICCGPGTVKWIVAPSCTQVTRNWHARGDAVTLANYCMGSFGWFVPSCGQIVNPGRCCRTYWDSVTPSPYWTNTERAGGFAWHYNISNGVAHTDDHHAGNNHENKRFCKVVRAFRCLAT